MSEPSEIEALPREIDGPLLLHSSRIDVSRSTRIFACPNVDGDVHVTFGNNQATLIMHPHAARRLMKAMAAVLDGKDFDRG